LWRRRLDQESFLVLAEEIRQATKCTASSFGLRSHCEGCWPWQVGLPAIGPRQMTTPSGLPSFQLGGTRQMKFPASSRVRNSRNFYDTSPHESRLDPCGPTKTCGHSGRAVKSFSAMFLPLQVPQFSPGLNFILLVRSKFQTLLHRIIGEMREQAVRFSAAHVRMNFPMAS
jgi:hypothetical protein